MKRRLPLGPAEGWLTLACVLLICLTMAWAIDDARWVLGKPDYLDLLVLAAVGGVLVGFIGPKVGWGRWLTFLIGAIFAALLVPLLVGAGRACPAGRRSATLYLTTADVGRPGLHRHRHPRPVVDAAIPALHPRPGAWSCWATSMFASYAVFGHHRPLNAVVVVGVILRREHGADARTTSSRTWSCTASPRCCC